MKNRPGRHLDVRVALDFLEGRLGAPARREVEEHLGGPCPECHERVRALGMLVERMTRDRTPEVPAWLHARALAAYAPGAAAAGREGLVERLARLVFDTLAAPLPAAARRSVGEARRLRFDLGGRALELEIESESARLQTLRGRLEAPEPALGAVEIDAEGERFIALPDAGGAFLLEHVPAGALEVSVALPDGRYRIPTIAP